MTTEQIKNELQSSGVFNEEELQQIQGNDFKSWEFWIIRFLTNSDLYYLDETTEETLNNADQIIDTESGRAFCFS